MKNLFLISILFLLPIFSSAQTLTSSNLPIVIINTDNNPYTGMPQEILDEPKALGTMKVIYRPDGSRNYVSDQTNESYLNYNGRIGIEIRGSSSQILDKKPYGLSTLKSDNVTEANVSILGLPKENDWVLNSLAFDQSLMRNYLSYDLSRSIGQYASRCIYCEVIINGEYKGLYMFMEKIKVDSDRVNIIKMTKSDNALPALTGGYIIKADKTTGGDPVAWTMASYNGSVAFLDDSPKPTEITTLQNNYIYNQFNNFQNVMTAQNASIVDGFPSMIDVPTFIDFMIINELASNADAYQYSTFFHKDRNGKLRAGPIWDFDLTYGNDLYFWGFDRSHTNVWQFDNGDNTGAKFWKDLYNNPTFNCYLTKRWRELNATNGPLNYSVISTKIDQIDQLISEAMSRENSKWHTISNHGGEISNMKNWISSRINWINTYLSSYQNCENTNIPPLVITKINYNPIATQGHLSNDIEFIEITNNGTQSVDLTGIYFKELGITYQFPANSSMAPNSVIYLASNSTAFQQLYGLSPFGQYTRNLSNLSQKLVLADAYGNIIDYVEYQAIDPWPLGANSNGYYLQLNDINSDNSLATNWGVSANLALEIKNISLEKSLSIYPNPAQSTINIESGQYIIKSFEIYDLRGRNIMAKAEVNAAHFTINIENLRPDMYILKLIYKDGKCILQKFNKLPY
jgi:hypothetical protein